MKTHDLKIGDRVMMNPNTPGISRNFLGELYVVSFTRDENFVSVKNTDGQQGMTQPASLLKLD